MSFKHVKSPLPFPFNFVVRDVVTDVNILQGAIFHEDAMEDAAQMEAIESVQGESQRGNGEGQQNPLESKPKHLKDQPKPAAHRVRQLVVIFAVHLNTVFL